MTWHLKSAQPKPKQSDDNVRETVERMLKEIEEEGDAAVRRYAKQLDRWEGSFKVSPDALEEISRRMPATFKEDFAYSYRQVTEFAKRQRDSLSEFEIELQPGVWLGQRLIPVSKVGCYIPGGKYPLVAAAIMSIGTARTAGVDHIVSCAPPRDADGIYAPQLYAMHAAGADEIYVLGGIQAMAAMAFGCVGMAPVDILTGPGNPYVAEAKRQLFGRVGLDLLAGPTEILVIADDSADPALVATDLLGQAEHGPDSPVWLVTTSEPLGRAVLREIDRQLQTLPTAEIASRAWANNGEVVVVETDDEAIGVSDTYAPEHLEVMTRQNDYYLKRLRNYGSLFLGEESTVAYGDKGVGTNHTLPTGRAARYTGGLWVGKFIKTVTYQKLTPAASRQIAPIMSRICEIEGMAAHQITADVRYSRYAPKNTEVNLTAN
jgi:sulfopropanediol 3-dehydrogenase